jgi:hypothetical protein
MEDRNVIVWNMTSDTIIYEIKEEHGQGYFGFAVFKKLVILLCNIYLEIVQNLNYLR